MILGFHPSAAAIAATLTVIASASQAQGDPSRGYATQPYTPPGFTLPGGVGCAGDIARWEAIQANDYAGGNVSPKVYKQIQDEISRARAACQAGEDFKARRLVADSRRRHGYPP